MASELPATAIGAFVRARAREQFNDVRSCSCISADRNGIVTRVGLRQSVRRSIGGRVDDRAMLYKGRNAELAVILR